MKIFILICISLFFLLLPSYAQTNTDNQTIQKYDAQNRPVGKVANPEAEIPYAAISDSNSSDPVKPDSKKDSSIVYKVLNVIFSLAIVVVVAILIAKLLKKIYYGEIKMPGNAKIPEPPTKGGLIRIVETASIGQGRMLYLITVENRAFLVASSGQQFTLIGEFVDEEWQKNITIPPVQGSSPIEVALGRILGNKEKQS